MKYIILLALFFLARISYSQVGINRDLLHEKIVDFLIEENDLMDDTLSYKTTIFINEIVSNDSLSSQEKGIFRFKSLSSNSGFHLLIKSGEYYKMISMYRSFVDIIDQVLMFFNENSEINRKSILLYMSEISELYKLNELQE